MAQRPYPTAIARGDLLQDINDFRPENPSWQMEIVQYRGQSSLACDFELGDHDNTIQDFSVTSTAVGQPLVWIPRQFPNRWKIEDW
jgi:hypothetical protein